MKFINKPAQQETNSGFFVDKINIADNIENKSEVSDSCSLKKEYGEEEEVDEIKRKPFHEALVGAILSVQCPHDAEIIAGLVGQAIIPRGHDEIIRVIKVKKEQIASSWWFDIEQVVLAQKVEAEAREAEKQKKQAEGQAKQTAIADGFVTKFRMLMELNKIIVDSRLTPRLILQFCEISDAIARAETDGELKRIQSEIDLLKTAQICNRIARTKGGGDGE